MNVEYAGVTAQTVQVVVMAWCLTVAVYAAAIIHLAVIAAVCRSLMIVVKCVMKIIAVHVMISLKMTASKTVQGYGAVN